MKQVAITLSIVAGCSGPNVTGHSAEQAPLLSKASAPSATAARADAPAAASDEDAPPAAEPERFVRITTPLFDDSPNFVELGKTTWALAQPFADGERLGLVSGATPIGIKSHVVNDDCETPWIEVEPRGFVCATAKPADPAKLSKKESTGNGLGAYAIAAKGARFYKSVKAAEEGKSSRTARGDMMRLGKSVTLEDGRVFRKTDRGEYIASSDIRRLYGSKFAGAEIPATLSGPLAFVVHRKSIKSKVVARAEPRAKARQIRKLPGRTLVEILEISDDGLFARVGDGEWVERLDLREIDVQAPPADVGDGPDARWADIDLDKQIVVVYDGRLPVFATLVSSGRERDRTPTGVFRVTRKKRRTTMRSDRSRSQTYSAAVPWSTYFHEGIAFHTAYWHDTFGTARSHGCVNLSPADAKMVYSLLGPEVPRAWSVVYGHQSQMGSIVQVRSVRPNPVMPPDGETGEEDDDGESDGDVDVDVASAD